MESKLRDISIGKDLNFTGQEAETAEPIFLFDIITFPCLKNLNEFMNQTTQGSNIDDMLPCLFLRNQGHDKSSFFL